MAAKQTDQGVCFTKIPLNFNGCLRGTFGGSLTSKIVKIIPKFWITFLPADCLHGPKLAPVHQLAKKVTLLYSKMGNSQLKGPILGSVRHTQEHSLRA